MQPTSVFLCVALAIFNTALATLEARPAARTGISRRNDGDGTYYPFSGAVYVEKDPKQDLSAAVGVQCPAHNPVSCSSIGESNYCCPSDNTCAYSDNHEVGCCPHGQKCTGSISGAGSYKPTSHYKPQVTTEYYHQPKQTTEYYHPPAKTVYAAGGYNDDHDDGKYYDQHDDKHDDWDGHICATIVREGPGLPRTAAADCGTMLIVAPAEAARMALGWIRLAVMVVGLQVLGGVILGAHALR